MSSRRTNSSSVPRYETKRPGRVHASPSPEPESYHGPQFERAMAQEQYWDSKGLTQVWDPYRELSSVAARPDTHSLAHSYHGSTLEHGYTDPYKKRPDPYTARALADYNAYKGPSDGHGHIAREVNQCKKIQVGRKVSPHDHHRESYIKGKDLAREARDMANIAAQSRRAFDQKYPQAYENHKKVNDHTMEANKHLASAASYRLDDAILDKRLEAWEKQMIIRGRR